MLKITDMLQGGAENPGLLKEHDRSRGCTWLKQCQWGGMTWKAWNSASPAQDAQGWSQCVLLSVSQGLTERCDGLGKVKLIHLHLLLQQPVSPFALRIWGSLVSQILECGRASIFREQSRVLNIAESGNCLDVTGIGNVLWGFHV